MIGKSIKSIEKVISHRVFPKKAKEPAYAETSETLLSLEANEKQKLIERIEEAIYSSNKFFLLDFDDQGEDSFYSRLVQLKPNCTDDIFITISQEFSDRLADSQRSTRIPGGYCLIGDGYLDNGNYLFLL